LDEEGAVALAELGGAVEFDGGVVAEGWMTRRSRPVEMRVGNGKWEIGNGKSGDEKRRSSSQKPQPRKAEPFGNRPKDKGAALARKSKNYGGVAAAGSCGGRGGDYGVDSRGFELAGVAGSRSRCGLEPPPPLIS
jgi:hypothetical protein